LVCDLRKIRHECDDDTLSAKLVDLWALLEAAEDHPEPERLMIDYGEDYEAYGYSKLDQANQTIADLKRETADLRARAEAAEAKNAALHQRVSRWRLMDGDVSELCRALLREFFGNRHADLTAQVGEESGGDAGPSHPHYDMEGYPS
jgi:hypothetical protein